MEKVLENNRVSVSSVISTATTQMCRRRLTVLIESLFVIPGLGSVMMNGISNRDFMLVANGVLIISIFVAICNLVVDILYGIIDPRTR